MALLLATSALLGRREHHRILLRCTLTCPEGDHHIPVPRVSAAQERGPADHTCPSFQTPKYEGFPFFKQTQSMVVFLPLDVAEEEDDM